MTSENEAVHDGSVCDSSPPTAIAAAALLLYDGYSNREPRKHKVKSGSTLRM
jgi:hypothetical protein